MVLSFSNFSSNIPIKKEMQGREVSFSGMAESEPQTLVFEQCQEEKGLHFIVKEGAHQ